MAKIFTEEFVFNEFLRRIVCQDALPYRFGRWCVLFLSSFSFRKITATRWREFWIVSQTFQKHKIWLIVESD